MSGPLCERFSDAHALFEVVRLVSGSEGTVFVFAFYGDDSEETGSSMVALGGYLATIDQWRRFETLATAVYDEFEITGFHAKKFHQAKGEFKSWDGDKRRRFCERLFQAALGNVQCGVCICVSKKMMKRFKAADRRTSRLSPYGLAFEQLTMMNCTGSHMPIERTPRAVSFILESGSKNNGELVAKMNRKSRMNPPPYGGNVKSLTFAPKGSCKAIELADFFAFYGRRYGKFLFANKAYVYEEMPSYLRIASEKIPHAINILSGFVLGREKTKLVVGPSRVFYLGPLMPRENYRDVIGLS